jgi:hypothetical protein
MSFKSLTLSAAVPPDTHVVNLAGSVPGGDVLTLFEHTPTSSGFVVMHIDLKCSARGSDLQVSMTSPSGYLNQQDVFTHFVTAAPSGTLSPRTWILRVNANQPYSLQCTSVGAGGTVNYSGAAVLTFLSA